MAWKNRHELPVLKKLPIHFDIERIKFELKKFSQSRRWDGLGAEYSSLCENHTRLPKMFFKKEEIKDIECICDLNWEDTSYKQLSLTEFDASYSLNERIELSGSAWDQRVAKKNPKADERWFRKKVNGLPSYIEEIINSIKGVHRTRIAGLAPQSSVKPHIDYDTMYSIRLHLAVDTNDGCINGGISSDGKVCEEHIPADGSLWFVNPGVKHWAKNFGNTPRNHIIFSVDSQKLISDL